MRFDQQQIDLFYNQGWLALPDVFTADEITKLGQEGDQLVKIAKSLEPKEQIHQGAKFVFEGDQLVRVVWCAAICSLMNQIGQDPRLTAPSSQLLGASEIDQLLCQFHIKSPGGTSHYDWHQDSQHRCYGTDLWKDVNGKGSYVQTAIALDDLTQENGTLVFVPHSVHRGHMGLDQDPGQMEQFDPDEFVAIEATAGSVIFFHPFAIHGSSENHSDRARRILINGYAPPGANFRDYVGSGTGRRLIVKNT